MESALLPSRLLALAEYVTEIEPSEYLLEAEVCTIGRVPPCQIVVPNTLVSRHHASIKRVGPRYLLYDEASTNGTFVNGARITEPYRLSHQDIIGLGIQAGMLRFLDADPTSAASSRLRYDERSMLFYLGSQAIELPPTQFRLLAHLYRHVGGVCTRESCAQAIWGRNYDPGMDADALDHIVISLRSRLRELDPTANLIKTRRGVGYELDLQ